MHRHWGTDLSEAKERERVGDGGETSDGINTSLLA